jgi:hypothetical protein
VTAWALVALTLPSAAREDVRCLFEVDSPSAGVVVHLAVPDGEPRTLACLRALARLVSVRTRDYGQREMRRITGGRNPEVFALPNGLWIRVEGPAANLPELVSLADSLAFRASLPEEEFLEQAKTPEAPGGWYTPLIWSWRASAPVALREVRTLYGSMGARGPIRVAVGGPRAAGELTQLWQSRQARREPSEYPTDWPRLPYALGVSPLAVPKGGYGMLVPAAPVREAMNPAEVLAMAALGSGKGSALFRVAREKRRLSYRQEALLLPEGARWRPALVFFADPAPPEAEVEALRTELLADVEAWTEPDLVRARGAAEGIYRYGQPYGNLLLTPDGPGEGSLVDRLSTLLIADSAGKPIVTPLDLLAGTEAVDLDDLKATARRLLSGMKAIVR